jgi:uncharacterized membrane protein
MLGIPLHVFVVHFPVALTLIAIVYDARAFFGGQPELHETGYRLTLWSAAGSVVAILTGFQILGTHLGRTSGMHAGAGAAGGITMIALAIFRYSARARNPDSTYDYPVSWLALELLAGVAILAAAIMGHRMVLGSGT